jgi:hypothetical protein
MTYNRTENCRRGFLFPGLLRGLSTMITLRVEKKRMSEERKENETERKCISNNNNATRGTESQTIYRIDQPRQHRFFFVLFLLLMNIYIDPSCFS